MDGSTMNAGAVAGVRLVRNPILAARAVMEQSPHVLLAGEGADAFARTMGLAMVDNQYFDTPFRKQQWLRARRNAGALRKAPRQGDHKFGTVGAVALDRQGHLAAGTSTGGMTNKAWGRIGDSPIVGAGTYASDSSCAVSATGHGEFFIRYTVARDICARVEFGGRSLRQAADEVIMQRLKAVGGEGGVIALDRSGEPVLVFNSEGMYRAWRTGAMKGAATAIFAEDKTTGTSPPAETKQGAF
jgi:beta-aspartyl-peptidase (threonine type)